jgi:hypothetical protein
MNADQLFDEYVKLAPAERRDFNLQVRGFEARPSTGNGPKPKEPRKPKTDGSAEEVQAESA